MSKTPLLKLDGISKSFAGVKALVDVDFEARPGEVHALLGENGAGKSTLIKIIAGVHRPDSGTITIDGKPVTFSTPREATHAGIATVYQEPLLFPDLNVAENIFISHPEPRRGDQLAARCRARQSACLPRSACRST